MMSNGRSGGQSGEHGIRSREEGRERREVERLMDEISSQSFPASDPPAWGVVASRLEEIRHGAPGPEAPGGGTNDNHQRGG